MLYTLDITISDDLPPDEIHRARSIVLSRMAGVLSDVVGATGSLRTIDLDTVPDDDEPDPAAAAAAQFGVGYNAGFNNGWSMAMNANAVMANIAPLPEAMTRVAAGLRDDDTPPPDPEPAPAAAPHWFDDADTEPEFPDRMHIGPAAGMGALLVDDPDHPGQTVTAADLARRYRAANGPATLTLPTPPPGPRPVGGPGAPISAFDKLTAETATYAYAFPDRPRLAAEHTDSEDAQWEFNDWDRDNAPYWLRQTYPAKWGEEVPGTSTITLTVDDVVRARNGG